MFDLFQTLEEAATGEVEMVSLMPEFEAEPEVEEVPEFEAEPEVEEVPEFEAEPEMPEPVSVQMGNSKVAMSRCYEIDGKRIEITYINYNKVCISKEGEPSILKEFASTIEAVDYYVEKMKELEADE